MGRQPLQMPAVSLASSCHDTVAVRTKPPCHRTLHKTWRRRRASPSRTHGQRACATDACFVVWISHVTVHGQGGSNRTRTAHADYFCPTSMAFAPQDWYDAHNQARIKTQKSFYFYNYFHGSSRAIPGTSPRHLHHHKKITRLPG